MPPALHPSGADLRVPARPRAGRDRDRRVAGRDVRAARGGGRRASSASCASALAGRPEHEGPVGGRHDLIFRFACAMRRWTSSEDEILRAALAYNERHCDPPMSGAARVRSQVRGAVKMAGRPPDPDELELRRQADRVSARVPRRRRRARRPGRRARSRPGSRRRRELRRRATSAIEARGGRVAGRERRPARHAQRSVAGVGGLGKSMLALAWAAEVTRRGLERPDRLLRGRGRAGDPPALRGARRRPRPAVRALDRPARGLDLVPARPAPSSTATRPRPSARLIVIDPVSASIDLKLDAHKDRTCASCSASSRSSPRR